MRMAETSESPLASSIPTNESVNSRRKRERAERFLAGSSRAAYRLDPLLERSLSTSQGTETESEPEDRAEEVHWDRQAKRKEEWKRGCPAVLQGLAKTYESFVKHTGRTAQYRRSNYSCDQSPRNITGE